MERRAPRSKMSMPTSPVLRFTPYAWAKLLFLRDAGPTEIACFGVSAEDDLLLVRDMVLPKQNCSADSVTWHDDSIADYFDDQVELDRDPQQFGRISIHTHPNGPLPSPADEKLFLDLFGRCDWAVMFILARDGATYARIRFGAGPTGQFQIPVAIDYQSEFEGSDREGWAAEYQANVTPCQDDAFEPDEYADEIADDEIVPWGFGHDDFDEEVVFDHAR